MFISLVRLENIHKHIMSIGKNFNIFLQNIQPDDQKAARAFSIDKTDEAPQGEKL